MRYLVVSIFLFQYATIHGQRMLERQIDVDIQGVPLEDVLNKLQQEYQVYFSYGFDNVTGRTPISIQAKGISIYRLIQKLALAVNLEFIFVGTIIVLRKICYSCEDDNHERVLFLKPFIPPGDSTNVSRTMAVRPAKPSVRKAQFTCASDLPLKWYTLAMLPFLLGTTCKIYSQSISGLGFEVHKNIRSRFVLCLYEKCEVKRGIALV